MPSTDDDLWVTLAWIHFINNYPILNRSFPDHGPIQSRLSHAILHIHLSIFTSHFKGLFKDEMHSCYHDELLHVQPRMQLLFMMVGWFCTEVASRQHYISTDDDANRAKAELNTDKSPAETLHLVCLRRIPKPPKSTDEGFGQRIIWIDGQHNLSLAGTIRSTGSFQLTKNGLRWLGQCPNFIFCLLRFIPAFKWKWIHNILILSHLIALSISMGPNLLEQFASINEAS